MKSAATTASNPPSFSSLQEDSDKMTPYQPTRDIHNMHVYTRPGHLMYRFENWVYGGLWYTNSLHVHVIDRQSESLRVVLSTSVDIYV